jgi:hypothetical protein
MTYSPNSYTTTTEVLVKSATTTGLIVKVLDSTIPSGAATAANQVTGNNSLSNIENKIVGLTIIAGRLQVELPSGGGGLTDAELRASPVPVTVTGTASVVQSGTWNVNISATALPLMTGLTTVAGRLQVDTQGLTNAELRASPVPTVLTSSSVTLLNNIGITGTVTVTGGLTDTQLRATPVVVSLTGTASVSVSNTVTISPIPSGTNNIGNVGLFYSGTAISLTNPIPVQPPASGNFPVSQSGTWNVNVTGGSGLTDVQLRATPVPVVLTSSSITILGGAVAISGTVSVVQSGTWNVNVSSTSLDSINTKTPNLGQTTAAGSTPVVIASNQTTIPVALTASSVTILAGTNNIGDVDILSIAAGDNNIGNVDIVTAPTLSINPIIATQATTTSLGATVAAQTVAALNANRLGLYVFNEVESGFMYLRYGANASAASYSIRIAAGGFWEMPQPIFTGQITAAFSVSTTTSAKVTEVTK